jgi:hypothetical protein
MVTIRCKKRSDGCPKARHFQMTKQDLKSGLNSLIRGTLSGTHPTFVTLDPRAKSGGADKT